MLSILRLAIKIIRDFWFSRTMLIIIKLCAHTDNWQNQQPIAKIQGITARRATYLEADCDRGVLPRRPRLVSACTGRRGVQHTQQRLVLVHHQRVAHEHDLLPAPHVEQLHAVEPIVIHIKQIRRPAEVCLLKRLSMWAAGGTPTRDLAVIEFRNQNRTTNLGMEHGGLGCHRYLRYAVSGRPMRRQSNSLRTKGQLAASYSGYDSSTTQLPLYTSHDEPPAAAWGCSCWRFRGILALFFPAVAVQAASTRIVAKSKPRRFISSFSE